ncbi:MAG TPA: metal-dependent transcriptional regulator [Methanocorpusculum sp.]|nr:metal-dependent transcriptional regulator [Methanocorpusculum sp.]
MDPAAAYQKHLSVKEEDYLESILNTILEKGYARSHDIAEDLHVVPSAVSEMFAKLGEKNLVNYRKYEGVTLTPAGRLIAEQVKFRHTILVEFLEILGVPKKIADADACFMEHELNTVTIQKIKEFVKNSRKDE